MRILNVDGRYLVSALRARGHEVLTIGTAAADDLRITSYLSLRNLWQYLSDTGFAPDMILWCDTCRPPMVMGIETLPALTVAWTIDQYCNPWHYSYSAAFDLVLAAQKDYLPLFAAENVPRAMHWFPLCCDADHDVDPFAAEDEGFASRDIPVSFVGTVTGSINKDRKKFLDAFKRRHALVVRQGDYRPVFGRSNIVLNQSAAGELNFRLFQAAACGAAVLNEDSANGLRDIFTPGEDLLPPYPRGNAQAAVDAAALALADLDALEDIALAGRDLVRSRHSTAARAAELESLAGRMLAGRAQSWRLEHQDVVRDRVGTAMAMLAADEELPLEPAHRKMFLDLSNAYRNAGRG